MEISITEFRRNLFDLVNQAMEGKELWVLHKGRRFRIAPETQTGSRLGRISPVAVVNTESRAVKQAASTKSDMLDEMMRAWERDWSDL